MAMKLTRTMLCLCDDRNYGWNDNTSMTDSDFGIKVDQKSRGDMKWRVVHTLALYDDVKRN